MSSEPSPPPIRTQGPDDDMGFTFYVKLAGIVLVGGVVAAIMMFIFFRAVYAWGLLGGFIAFALILLAVGWAFDRRKTSSFPRD